MKINESGSFISPITEIVDRERSVSQDVQSAQDFAELLNQARRHATRMAYYAEWVKPENIAARLKEYEENAEKALEAGKQLRKAVGLPDEEPPLPEDLPKHMRGQQPSMIRVMLKHDGWKYNKDLMKWSQK